MAKSKRKISRREEAAYAVLEHQTRGREKSFEWWQYKESNLRWQEIGYNRSKCTSSGFYLGWREMQAVQTHFPEHLPLVQQLNVKAELMEESLRELNKLREQLINTFRAECPDIDRCHLDYELISEEDEAELNRLRAEKASNP